MTFHLTFGIDPGLSGALATLADGRLISLHDMPTMERVQGSGTEIDGRTLMRILRGQRAAHPGAYVLAVLEKVNGGAGFGKERRQSTSSMFNFGQGDGKIRGVLEALEIDIVDPRPQTWKKYYGLMKTEKDAARLKAIELFPNFRAQLARKKDGGRADAALIGAWAHCVEASPWEPKPAEIFRQAAL